MDFLKCTVRVRPLNVLSKSSSFETWRSVVPSTKNEWKSWLPSVPSTPAVWKHLVQAVPRLWEWADPATLRCQGNHVFKGWRT